jgi:hypothetical protein
LPEQTTVLELYIEYDALLAEQLATVVQGISRAYAVILENISGFPGNRFSEDLYRFGRPLVERLNPYGYPPLAITRAETGQSVKLGFGPVWDLKIADGDVELTVPRSRATAAVVVVASALTFGMGLYGKFLETQKAELEIEKLKREIAAMPALTPQAARSFRYQINAVRDALAYPTIKSVQVNGVRAR